MFLIPQKRCVISLKILELSNVSISIEVTFTIHSPLKLKEKQHCQIVFMYGQLAN